MSREGQAPPPDHEDKPLATDDKSDVGERITGVRDPQDPDGLLTVGEDEPGITTRQDEFDLTAD